jgi:hypothetical protein
VRIQSPDRGQHTHRQLGTAHFHRENTDRQTGVDRHILGNIQGKSRFTH